MARDGLYKEASSPFYRYSNLSIRTAFAHNHALEAVWNVHAASFQYLYSRFFHKGVI